MVEVETQALTLKQVRANRRLEWMAENTQRQNDNLKSSENFQEEKTTSRSFIIQPFDKPNPIGD
jgi:hypothetical protein